jgi:hypothetical protein
MKLHIITLLPLALCACQAPRGTAATPAIRYAEPVAHRAQTEPADAWSFAVAPYFWTASIHGEAEVGPLPPTDVDLSFGDILEDLQFGFMLAVEARKAERDWALLFDAFYLDLEDEGNVVESNLSGVMVEADVAYAPGDQAYYELLAGLRYWSFDVDLDILAVASASRGKDWLDPVVGARTVRHLSDDWSLVLRGDVGGFGVGSDFSFQGVATFRYALGESTELGFGYRHLCFDLDEDDLALDAAISGPVLGFSWDI